MLQRETYAENLRWAAKTRENPQGRPLAVREIANGIGYSYELVRSALLEARPLAISRQANDKLCDYLGLPKEEMWVLAMKEKHSNRAGFRLPDLKDKEGLALSALWPELTADEREVVLEVARHYTEGKKQAKLTDQPRA